MYYSIATLVAALAAFAAAVPAAVPHLDYVVHEKRDLDATSKTWVKRSTVPVGRALPIRIGLTQSNLDEGHDMLMAVSEHDSPSFGKHYTQEEIIDLFAPAKSTVDAVRAWLESAGIKDVTQSTNKQWLQVDVPVEQLDALLQTSYHEFEHQETGAVHVACDQYHVPAAIQEHIDFIKPGVVLHKPERKRRVDHIGGALAKRNNFRLPPIVDTDLTALLNETVLREITTCDYFITPGCVRRLYNITVGTTAVAGNELGIFEDVDDILDQADLDTFFSTTIPTIPKGTGPMSDPIDGAPGLTTQKNGGGESVLDFELSIPILYPQKTILFQTDDQPTESNYTYQGFLNNFFDALDGSYCSYAAFGETGNSPIDPPYPDNQTGGYTGALQCGKYEPTNVISISYGGDESSMPVNYQRRQCNEIMKLGMQGITVVVASGDSGVAGRNEFDQDICIGADLEDGHLKGKIFNPDFPATCPYITSVGATFLPYPRNVFKDNEIAVNRFKSGGGLSNIYPQPDYQKAIVQNYLTKYASDLPAYQTLYNETTYNNSGLGKNGGIYNSIGRAYPDFSAAGDGILNVLNGLTIIEGGTSASAPIFASILTRINEHRLLANKSTIGFVNPTLYAHPEVFHDITQGNNDACAGKGFKCAPGWDPVSGMGTPNFGLMLELYMSLP